MSSIFKLMKGGKSKLKDPASFEYKEHSIHHSNSSKSLSHRATQDKINESLKPDISATPTYPLAKAQPPVNAPARQNNTEQQKPERFSMQSHQLDTKQDYFKPTDRRVRHISIQSAGPSTFSQSDAGYFSLVGDSVFTELTNDSYISSIFKPVTALPTDHNDFIIRPYDSCIQPIDDMPFFLMEEEITEKSLLDYIMDNPKQAFDVFIDILRNPETKNNNNLKQQVYKAAQTWSKTANDPSAKVTVAKCKLCGWGTPFNPEQGFTELKNLANEGCWESYMYLGQCYYFGVNRTPNTLASSGKVTTPTDFIHPVDRKKAIFWFEKALKVPSDVHSKYLDVMMAHAQLYVSVSRFSQDQSKEGIEKNINLLKSSASFGHRIAEFLLGFLIDVGYTTDETSAKEYYTRSANQLYTPAQIQLGMLLLLEEKSSEGVTWLEKAAQLGDSRASYQLGLIHELGLGVEKDNAIAISNFHHAIELNNAMAQFHLGYNYLHGGIGLSKNIDIAYKYVYSAAKDGYPDAEFLLGLMYRDGLLPKQAYFQRRLQAHHYDKALYGQEAFYWFKNAADKKLPNALTQIARCHQDGVGTPVNPTLATQYFERAIDIPGKHIYSAQISYAQFLQKNGHDEQAFDLYMTISGISSDSSMISPLLVRTAKRTVAVYYLNNGNPTIPYKPNDGFEILSQLVTDGEKDPESHYWYAACFEEGVPAVCPIDLKKAYSHYLISARLGYSKAQFQVGVMLCKGRGVTQNHREAFNCFLAASEQNYLDAYHQVALYYYKGSPGITRNLEKADKYFKKAAELGKRDSMAGYAQTCQDKIKLIKNTAASSSKPLTPEQQKEIIRLQNNYIHWYKEAAKLNHTASLREVGKLYDSGLGVKQDYARANSFFQRASEQGDPLATLLLGSNYENGSGVTVDSDQAIRLYHKALEYGQPTALYAIAKLHEKLKNYEQAYQYYLRVLGDSRISKNTHSTKISSFKVALYNLNYSPAFSDHPDGNSSPIMLNPPFSTSMPPNQAFQTLYKLAVYDNFLDSYIWIAECYASGNGTSQNIPESIRWIKKAADEAQDLNAMKKLAYMYENGIHVSQDLTLSQKYFHMCAEKNSVVCQHKLGMTFWRGCENIPINLGMAVIWFTRAARQNYPPSHWALGQIALENGDLHIAIAWWENAIRMGPTQRVAHMMNLTDVDVDFQTIEASPEALVSLGKLIQQPPGSTTEPSLLLDRDEANLVSRKIQERKGLALRCFGHAASMGNLEGMYLAAQIWHKDKDYPVALEFYEKASRENHVPSRIMYAAYQIYGLGGIEVDTIKGYNELVECAKINTSAYIHLGRCKERGLGTEKDINEAIKWYTLAIEKTDDSEAMFRLGQIYAQDTNDNTDCPDNGNMRTVYWYQRAISKDDHPRAHFKLAFYYVQGITASFGEKRLIFPDLVKAARHFRKSAQANDPDAMVELGQLLLSRHNQNNALFSPQLQEEGILWLEIAVEQGSRDACRELGNLYHSGREASEANEPSFFPVYPICQDFEKSFDYFNSAANLDDKTSALFLGSYYEHGICVPPNTGLAKSWYSVAIELGSSFLEESIPLDHPLGWWPAQLCLARVLYQSTETRKEAYSLFMAVYKHQPEQHMPYLEFTLAQYYLYGYGGVEVDAEKAVLKLTNLADCGYTKAFFHLAQCYERGLGVKLDLTTALHWYVQLVHNPASDPDSLDEDDLDCLSSAYFRLAEFYRIGEVVPADKEKSKSLYRIAAERGSKEAQEHLID